jgi:hypothetical protein
MIRQVIGLAATLSILTISSLSRSAAADLRRVDSAALGTSHNPPWSEPVQINDPFEGNFIGVFDRNYFNDRLLNTNARVEVQSLWSPQSARFLLITRDRYCHSGSVYYGRIPAHLGCSVVNNSRNLTQLFVRINNNVYQVSGQNSKFPINNELAQALQNAPEGNVSIRLVTETGETVNSEIGQGTVKAWKTVYSSQSRAIAK